MNTHTHIQYQITLEQTIVDICEQNFPVCAREWAHMHTHTHQHTYIVHEGPRKRQLVRRECVWFTLTTFHSKWLFPNMFLYYTHNIDNMDNAIQLISLVRVIIGMENWVASNIQFAHCFLIHCWNLIRDAYHTLENIRTEHFCDACDIIRGRRRYIECDRAARPYLWKSLLLSLLV